MIIFLLVVSAFFIGFSLNPVVEVKYAITSASVVVAILAVFLTHLFSKNRDRVKEYEAVYSLMCGICKASEQISTVVKSSKKKEYISEQPFKIEPSLEIHMICSEELLNVYKEHVYSIDSNKLFDPDSVIAVLKFKLHFNLFVASVIKYRSMGAHVNKETKMYLNNLLKERANHLRNGLLEKAENELREYNETAMICINRFCDAVLQQFSFMTEQKEKVRIGMEKAKRTFF